MEYIEKKVLSSDGKHMLCGRVYLPKGEAKGYFHIVHGMTEHIARYDAFMRRMAEEGYICLGYDNLGHGKTAASDDELGYIAKKDGWKRLSEDVAVFSDAVIAEYGEKPYILMGHSMGSFIARVTALLYKVPYKLIIMGTGGPNPASGIGIALIKLIKAFKGEKHFSGFIDNMAFASYNSRFEGDDKLNWLTKDAEIRRIYSEDKFCTFKFTVSAMGDLLRLNSLANSGRWFNGIDKNLPMLLVSGSEDPVGNYGKGIKAVYDKLQKSGANVKMKLYDDCRHEILNDTCRDEVAKDIIAFIG